MQNKTSILQLVSNYQLCYPTEQGSLELIISFLKNTSGDELIDRKNFNGHLTASAFVLNAGHNAVLLLHHKKLNRWLQPGGHIDVLDDGLVSAAMRETCEETGLEKTQLLPFFETYPQQIFDIDSHLIPANAHKNEPSHYHHDIRFLFSCAGEALFNLNTSEALGFKWVPITTLANDDTFASVAKKLLQVTSAEGNIATIGKTV